MKIIRFSLFQDSRKKPTGKTHILWVASIQKLNISCQYLNFAQTEDIWLKSALEGKRGLLLITGRKLVSNFLGDGI
jgi:hypothetical protein